jgi:hypothetical protein
MFIGTIGAIRSDEETSREEVMWDVQAQTAE